MAEKKVRVKRVKVNKTLTMNVIDRVVAELFEGKALTMQGGKIVFKDPTLQAQMQVIDRIKTLIAEEAGKVKA